MDKKTATRVRNNLYNYTGHAALYKCEPPMVKKSWDKEEPDTLFEYVVCSTASTFGVETYIFGANAEGAVVDWLDLPGSEKLTMSHSRVLTNAGYEPVGAPC